MIEVNEALTQKVASLARLELSKEEVQNFTSKLKDILDYVDTLMSVDVKGVEPLVRPIDLPTPLREDVVAEPCLDAEGHPKVLQSAPEVMYDGFKVPPIL